jgi:hypothetical protein
MAIRKVQPPDLPHAPSLSYLIVGFESIVSRNSPQLSSSNTRRRKSALVPSARELVVAVPFCSELAFLLTATRLTFSPREEDFVGNDRDRMVLGLPSSPKSV